MPVVGMKGTCRRHSAAHGVGQCRDERPISRFTPASRQERSCQNSCAAPAVSLIPKFSGLWANYERFNRVGPVRLTNNNGAPFPGGQNSFSNTTMHAATPKSYSGMPPDPLLRPASAPGAGSADNLGASDPPFTLKLAHVLLFVVILIGGVLYLALTLQLTSPDSIEFKDAMFRVGSRVMNSIAFRQLLVIASLILLVRFGLNWLIRHLGSWTKVNFDRTKTYYVIKEVYQPLELLLFIAGVCTIADAFVPQLISVPKNVVSHFVRATLAVSFIVCAASMAMRFKRQFCQENAWQAEMNGDITSQRRWEAYDKLGTFAVYVLAFIFVVQAVGLEVTSVLAIGGVGGLAIGLAGREIFENLFNGFLILTSNPFEVGDEVCFYPNGNKVEGLVMDIGWYRTLIRSFEREVYIIPNAVFSKNTVLNITRKGREWRFYEMISVRVQDVSKVNAIVSDMRRIIKNDQRILNSLHKRVYLDKITMEDIKIYISFYVEAATRDVFMTIKQDFLLGFIDCMHRNGAQLAQRKTLVELVGPTASNPMAVLDPFRSAQMPEEKNMLLTSVDELNISQELLLERKKRSEFPTSEMQPPSTSASSPLAQDPSLLAAALAAGLSNMEAQAREPDAVIPAGAGSLNQDLGRNGNGVLMEEEDEEDEEESESNGSVSPASAPLTSTSAVQSYSLAPASLLPTPNSSDAANDRVIDTTVLHVDQNGNTYTKPQQTGFSFHSWAANLVESIAVTLGFEPSRDVLPAHHPQQKKPVPSLPPAQEPAPSDTQKASTTAADTSTPAGTPAGMSSNGVASATTSAGASISVSTTSGVNTTVNTAASANGNVAGKVNGIANGGVTGKPEVPEVEAESQPAVDKLEAGGMDPAYSNGNGVHSENNVGVKTAVNANASDASTAAVQTNGSKAGKPTNGKPVVHAHTDVSVQGGVDSDSSSVGSSAGVDLARSQEVAAKWQGNGEHSVSTAAKAGEVVSIPSSLPGSTEAPPRGGMTQKLGTATPVGSNTDSNDAMPETSSNFVVNGTDVDSSRVRRTADAVPGKNGKADGVKGGSKGSTTAGTSDGQQDGTSISQREPTSVRSPTVVTMSDGNLGYIDLTETRKSSLPKPPPKDASQNSTLKTQGASAENADAAQKPAVQKSQGVAGMKAGSGSQNEAERVSHSTAASISSAVTGATTGPTPAKVQRNSGPKKGRKGGKGEAVAVVSEASVVDNNLLFPEDVDDTAQLQQNTAAGPAGPAGQRSAELKPGVDRKTIAPGPASTAAKNNTARRPVENGDKKPEAKTAASGAGTGTGADVIKTTDVAGPVAADAVVAGPVVGGIRQGDVVVPDAPGAGQSTVIVPNTSGMEQSNAILKESLGTGQSNGIAGSTVSGGITAAANAAPVNVVRMSDGNLGYIDLTETKQRFSDASKTADSGRTADVGREHVSATKVGGEVAAESGISQGERGVNQGERSGYAQVASAKVMEEAPELNAPAATRSTTAEDYLSELDSVAAPKEEEEDFFSTDVTSDTLPSGKPVSAAAHEAPFSKDQNGEGSRDQSPAGTKAGGGMLQPAASAISALAAALPKLVSPKPSPPQEQPLASLQPNATEPPLQATVSAAPEVSPASPPFTPAGIAASTDHTLNPDSATTRNPSATANASAAFMQAVETLPCGSEDAHPAFSSMEMFEQVMLVSSVLLTVCNTNNSSTSPQQQPPLQSHLTPGISEPTPAEAATRSGLPSTVPAPGINPTVEISPTTSPSPSMSAMAVAADTAVPSAAVASSLASISESISYTPTQPTATPSHPSPISPSAGPPPLPPPDSLPAQDEPIPPPVNSVPISSFPPNTTSTSIPSFSPPTSTSTSIPTNPISTSIPSSITPNSTSTSTPSSLPTELPLLLIPPSPGVLTPTSNINTNEVTTQWPPPTPAIPPTTTGSPVEAANTAHTSQASTAVQSGDTSMLPAAFSNPLNDTLAASPTSQAAPAAINVTNATYTVPASSSPSTPPFTTSSPTPTVAPLVPFPATATMSTGLPTASSDVALDSTSTTLTASNPVTPPDPPALPPLVDSPFQDVDPWPLNTSRPPPTVPPVTPTAPPSPSTPSAPIHPPPTTPFATTPSPPTPTAPPTLLTESTPIHNSLSCNVPPTETMPHSLTPSAAPSPPPTPLPSAEIPATTSPSTTSPPPIREPGPLDGLLRTTQLFIQPPGTIVIPSWPPTTLETPPSQMTTNNTATSAPTQQTSIIQPNSVTSVPGLNSQGIHTPPDSTQGMTAQGTTTLPAVPNQPGAVTQGIGTPPTAVTGSPNMPGTHANAQPPPNAQVLSQTLPINPGSIPVAGAIAVAAGTAAPEGYRPSDPSRSSLNSATPMVPGMGTGPNPPTMAAVDLWSNPSPGGAPTAANPASAVSDTVLGMPPSPATDIPATDRPVANASELPGELQVAQQEERLKEAEKQSSERKAAHKGGLLGWWWLGQPRQQEQQQEEQQPPQVGQQLQQQSQQGTGSVLLNGVPDMGLSPPPPSVTPMSTTSPFPAAPSSKPSSSLVALEVALMAQSLSGSLLGMTSQQTNSQYPFSNALNPPVSAPTTTPTAPGTELSTVTPAATAVSAPVVSPLATEVSRLAPEVSLGINPPASHPPMSAATSGPTSPAIPSPPQPPPPGPSDPSTSSVWDVTSGQFITEPELSIYTSSQGSNVVVDLDQRTSTQLPRSTTQPEAAPEFALFPSSSSPLPPGSTPPNTTKSTAQLPLTPPPPVAMPPDLTPPTIAFTPASTSMPAVSFSPSDTPSNSPPPPFAQPQFNPTLPSIIPSSPEFITSSSPATSTSMPVISEQLSSQLAAAELAASILKSVVNAQPGTTQLPLVGPTSAQLPAPPPIATSAEPALPTQTQAQQPIQTMAGVAMQTQTPALDFLQPIASMADLSVQAQVPWQVEQPASSNVEASENVQMQPIPTLDTTPGNTTSQLVPSNQAVPESLPEAFTSAFTGDQFPPRSATIHRTQESQQAGGQHDSADASTAVGIAAAADPQPFQSPTATNALSELGSLTAPHTSAPLPSSSVLSPSSPQSPATWPQPQLPMSTSPDAPNPVVSGDLQSDTQQCGGETVGPAIPGEEPVSESVQDAPAAVTTVASSIVS